MALQQLRSSTANKRPTAAAMSDGQLAVNTNATNPGLFFKDADGSVRKVGPVFIGSSAPNSSPATGGSTGHAVGEQWLDNTGGTYVLKIWDGTAWRSESGTFVDVSGDTMTGALLLDNAASASAPDLSFDGDANTGLYSPGADQLALATNGTGRLFVDASGNVGIGTTSPSTLLHVNGQARFQDFIRGQSTANKLYIADDIALTATKKLYLDGGSNSYIHEASADNIAVVIGTERLRIDSSGRVLVGASSARTNFNNGSASPQIQIENVLNGNLSSIALIHNENNLGDSSSLNFGKTRGGAVGDNSALNQAGDRLGAITFQGNDGTEFVQAASIEGLTDGTPGSNDMPGRLVFGTTADGSSSPTERMRIDSSGNVGINRSAPDNQLSIGSNASLHTDSNSFYLGSNFTSTGSNFIGTGRHAQRLFFNNASGNGYLSYSNTSSAGTAGNAITWEERIRITSDGKIGIGTTSPSNQLHLHTTTTSNVLQLTNSATGTAAGDGMQIVTSSLEMQLRNREAGPTTFYTSNLERLRIDSSGKVGVGTTSPQAPFTISNSGAQGIEAGYSAGTSTNFIQAYNRSSSAFIQLDVIGNPLVFKTGTGATEAVRIDSSGRVGLGTSSPAQPLDIVTSAADAYIRQSNGVVTGFVGVNNANSAFDIYTFSNHPTRFFTNNAERLRITSDGKIGVGTSSPSKKLQVDSADFDTALFKRTNSTGSATIFISNASNHGAAIQSLGNGAGGFAIFTQTSNVITERMRIDSSGNVGIGTASATSIGGYTGLSINNATNGGFVDLMSNGSAAFRLLTNGSQCNVESRTAIPIIFFTNTVERMRIDSSGNVGIGTSSVSASRKVEIKQPSSYTAALRILADGNGNDGDIEWFSGLSQYGLGITHGTDAIRLRRDNTELMRINSSGDVGIGTTSPQAISGYTVLTLNNASQGGAIEFKNNNTSYGRLLQGSSAVILETKQNIPLIFGTGTSSTERMRIDSSGNVIFKRGADAGNILQITGADTTSETLEIGIASAGGNAQLTATHAAGGSNSCGLIFRTRGSGGTAERMRIDSSGNVLIGKTSAGIGNAGIELDSAAQDAMFTTYGATPLFVNRIFNDGVLISLQGQSVEEGSISVSGTTVSYNGAHLSRWSQLPGGATREEILRGTVLSNIDEMCAWGDEDNEQLNRMKVSDVEGDVNVSGVFQAWDDDDDTYTNDFYCAMTGDFVIRIAQGTTVARGDLLMSAGDGTAKPQDDDIVRSKTIAKVTSTTVSTTYSDGSYCVPCVLMAC